MFFSSLEGTKFTANDVTQKPKDIYTKHKSKNFSQKRLLCEQF